MPRSYPEDADHPPQREYNTRYRTRQRRATKNKTSTEKVRRGPSRQAKKRRIYVESSDEDDSDYSPSGQEDVSSSSECDSGDNNKQVVITSRHGGQHLLLQSALFGGLVGAARSSEQTEAEAEEAEEEARYLRTLSRRELREYRRKEEELEEHRDEQVPLRCRVVQLPIQASAKLLMLERIQLLQQMEEGTSEYPKLKQWVDAALKLPFGKYEDVPVSIQDGAARIRAYLRGLRQALDGTVHGHDVAKNDIMQLVSQWISNPQSMSQVLGIAGPPGTGKTTLVRHGIAQALGRPFVQISLGGATDACTLNGHSYTYEGATWGRVAGHLMQTKCMNPVIFFDEVDKVSESQTGQEIIGQLIHLTDPAQNDEFTDRYFDGVPLDLSRALMIFSFNDVTALNPILRDRLTVITTAPFKRADKVHICTRHLLPAVLKTVGFHKSDMILKDEIASYLIDRFSKDEEGVRALRRALHKMLQRLNVLRLTNGRLREGTQSRDTHPELPYTLHGQPLKFPLTLTRELVDKLLPASEDEQPAHGAPPPSMYS